MFGQELSSHILIIRKHHPLSTIDLNNMAFIKLPKVGHSLTTAAAEKDTHHEPAAFLNAKKVIQVLDAVEDWESIKDLVVKDAPFTCQGK